MAVHTSELSANSQLAATIGALGVVYGDIGTSPLYALKEAVKAAAAPEGSVSADAVLSVVSLIFWALILIISVKYALLILRADNRGEGGIVAMLALLSARNAKPGTLQGRLLIVGLVGAALLYGDGAITPAISVLSAVEGLKVDAPALAPLVVPLTIVVLIALFLMQRKGTGFIGRIFGPVTFGWFLAIALLGSNGIMRAPVVVLAIDPTYAFDFLAHRNLHVGLPVVNWLLASATLGAVIGFGTSDALAGAYGISVSLLMAITTLLAALVAMHWGYSPFVVLVVNSFS